MKPSKLFVTGGTGVLGRPTVALLVSQGHSVRVAVRSGRGTAAIEALGAEPVEVDLFDPDSMRAAVAGTSGILHLATKIPPLAKMARRSAWLENDRLRAETTAHLAAAARAEGVELLLAESVTFMYPDCGDSWIDESELWPSPHPQWESTYALENHVAEFTQAGGRGIVARFGLLYGPESRSVDEALRLARIRAASLAGAASGYVSSIHSDDAATALVAMSDAPAGVYNVVDDEPLTRRDYLDSFSHASGFIACTRSPRALRLTGGAAADILLRSQRVSNAKLRDIAGWAPTHKSVRDGWPAVAALRATSAA